MLVDEENVVLEARVEMRLQSKLDDDRVVVAVDVSVDAVEALEHVANEGWKGLRERYTDTAGEHLLVIDVGLHPGHQVSDVLGRWHLGGALVVLAVLPKVLESTSR